MPDLFRYETVDWSMLGHGDTTLGELRTLLREVADWPDAASVDCQKVSIRRLLPIVTASETDPDEEHVAGQHGWRWNRIP